jgi:antitoxin (DNA-binding transcriptional repressor) of toxin-antitoxin stability system
MKTLGLRELKNRLAEYVRDVRSGEAGLAALAKAGRLTLGAENTAAAYPKLSRLLKRRRAADLLDEERGNR